MPLGYDVWEAIMPVLREHEPTDWTSVESWKVEPWTLNVKWLMVAPFTNLALHVRLHVGNKTAELNKEKNEYHGLGQNDILVGEMSKQRQRGYRAVCKFGSRLCTAKLRVVITRPSLIFRLQVRCVSLLCESIDKLKETNRWRLDSTTVEQHKNIQSPNARARENERWFKTVGTMSSVKLKLLVYLGKGRIMPSRALTIWEPKSV